MRRRVLCCLEVLCIALLLVAPAYTQTAKRKPGKLTDHDRGLVAESRDKGKATVTILIAVVPGSSSNVVSEIQKLNGDIRYQDDELNYIRAVVPVEQAERISALSGVDAAKIDEPIKIDDPVPVGIGEPVAVPPQPPGPSTPPMNPYMPTQDIGAPQFIRANPTFDGRGVKIAILDTGVDLLAPELQSAKTLRGFPVRKIIDWVNMNDPKDTTAPDPSWVNMEVKVWVRNGSFMVNSTTYSGVPGDGIYRFGIFDEGSISPDSTSQNSDYAIKAGDIWCADLNRNGMCHETFAVLWRMWDNTVWVDSNADRNFENELPMTDYKFRHDIGIFGVDNPETPVRESVPFVVQTDRIEKFVNVGIVAAGHGTHVAGIAAGKGFFGGAYNGAAPEAQIISVRVCTFTGGCTTHGLLEGMIYAVRKANADVVNMSIGGLQALNDGRTVATILYNRLIERTNTQMFISAGNAGPGINTVMDPANTALVMSVGASVTKDTWYSNYGVDAVRNEGLFTFSSRGPTEAGGFKPNIVAPGAAVSTIPAWQPIQQSPYALPPGYAMGNGTSMAAPQATGGAALLISAAKQTWTPHRAEQLRRAINSSARFLPAYGAHEQGNGLFQVPAAWAILRSNPRGFEITSAAPVKTVLSDQLEVPDTGFGIYQREGWTAGESRTLTITLTRKEGFFWPIVYALNWVGNDGTFSSAGSVVLPKDVPVELPVTVNPQTAGVHSSILNLMSAAGEGFDYQIMNTVVAAEKATAANDYTVTWNGSADRPESSTFFVSIPENVPYIKFDLTPLSGSLRLWAVSPEGLPYGYMGFSTSALSGRILKPPAGVWEVATETYALSPVTPATFSNTFTLQGVAIDPPSWTIDSPVIGNTYTQTFAFTNNFASFTGRMTSTTLTSVYKNRPTITSDQPQYFDLVVPGGLNIIIANTGNPSDQSANIDLYLYDCTAGAENCVLKASSTNSSSSEQVLGIGFAAGLWRVMVVPRFIATGSTEIDYSDSILNPSFGSIRSTDVPVLHPTGTTWSTVVSVTPGMAPEPGRSMEGPLYVIIPPYNVVGEAKINLKF
jgi:subtilisin family serine protease